LVAEDPDYGAVSQSAEFDASSSLLATTSFDGFVRLYNVKASSATEGLPQKIAPISKLKTPGGKTPFLLAFSPDGSRLAVGLRDAPKVDVLGIRDNVLSHAFSPDTSGIDRKQNLSRVAWSSDGRFLYAAGSYWAKGARRIRKWSDGGKGTYTDLAGGDAWIAHLLPLRSGGVAYCGLEPASFGALDGMDRRKLFQEADIANHGSNQEHFLISPDGWTVQFSFEASGKAPAIFSVPERNLTDISRSLFGSLKATFSLKATTTTGMDVTDWKLSSSPKLAGKPLAIPKGHSSISLAILPDRSGFLIGTDWSLCLFDSSGKALWTVPVNTALTVNTNGKLVVVACGDGAIRWYRISDGKGLLNFFPHKDGRRWVLWTPSGYYEASPGGEDLIGWHVNHGRDREGDFFPASRFRSVYARRDVIDKTLAAGDEAEGIRLANLESGRKEVEPVSIRESLPPVVAIISPADGSEVSTPNVNVRYSVRSRDPVIRAKVLLDGRPISPEGGIKPTGGGGEFTITIPQRDCELSLIAENRHAASEPASLRLRWKGQAPREEIQPKPRLFVLAVGVSEYKNPEMQLGLAAKDALDFGAAWSDQKGALYGGVEVRALTDSQATKEGILNGMAWLQREVTSNDVAVLFLAGHGIDDNEGFYYFLPVDADIENLKSTGLPQTDIVNTISAIAGKVLVFMDACHSGNLMGKTKRRGLFDINAVINELAAAENGAVVFSSSTGRQYSLENPDWGNGAFTKGLVEGIAGKADFRNSGRITVNMLDLYISERVKELTKGQQTPATVKPPNVPDFPIVVLRR
jgi:WD40 repeat protein